MICEIAMAVNRRTYLEWNAMETWNFIGVLKEGPVFIFRAEEQAENKRCRGTYGGEWRCIQGFGGET